MLVSDLAGLLGGLVTDLTPLVVIGFAAGADHLLRALAHPFGLRLRSCGENPVAAESLGVNVYRYKYIGVVVSGALAGLGGAALVLNPGQLGYLEGQTGGRGYIGLAAMIFGNWRPGGLLAGSALFGYVDGLQLRAGGEAVHALLYAATLLAVAVALFWVARRHWTPARSSPRRSGLVVYAAVLRRRHGPARVRARTRRTSSRWSCSPWRPTAAPARRRRRGVPARRGRLMTDRAARA